MTRPSQQPDIDIRLDDLQGGHIARLLNQHRQEMLTYSPPQSVHALDEAALHAPGLTFWSAWIAGEFAGCGALKELDQTHGEIKSMRCCDGFRKQGVGAGILERLLTEAQSRGYTMVSLETGSMDAFIPARNLYRKFGFQLCAPFADYCADPNSICMAKKL